MWLWGSALVDEFVWREAEQGLQAATIFVDVDEVLDEGHPLRMIFSYYSLTAASLVVRFIRPT